MNPIIVQVHPELVRLAFSRTNLYDVLAGSVLVANQLFVSKGQVRGATCLTFTSEDKVGRHVNPLLGARPYLESLKYDNFHFE